MSATEFPYKISSYLDTFTIYELTDSASDSRVLICPERGGIVIGCQLHGNELLYLDRSTFLDPSANIRGGIPVLFPICGQLKDGSYEWDGVTYSMRNHGIARTSAWQVASESTDDGASLTLILRSNEETLAAYPFAFELAFTYLLKNGKLTLRQSYRNLSERDMPVHAGFHPYFATNEKNLRYVSDAKRMLDCNDNEVKLFTGTVDLNELVESVVLLDPKSPSIAFPLGDVQVKLSYSDEFRIVVLWTLKDKPFVCVEPWTALNEALNRKEDLIMVAPGDELLAEFDIEVA